MITALLFATSLLAAPATAPMPQSADEHLAAGLAAYKRLHFKEAEAQFEAAHQVAPESAAALWYLGYAVYKEAEPKRPFHPEKRRAAELFAQAYELDPAFVPRW